MSDKDISAKYYPIVLRLNERLAVVIGGGRIAERKILGLIEARARVKVVSPVLTTKLKSLAKAGRIQWISREVRKDDLKKGLVIAATNQPATNKKISLWAEKNGLLVNVVDKPAFSNFISPAVFHKGKAVIAVNSNGRDPEFSRDLKNFLKGQWNEFLSYRRRLQKRAS